MKLFDIEIEDKPIKDSSFNQCFWQIKNDGGIMGQLVDVLTNSSDWTSSRCKMEWRADYVKKKRYIFILHISNNQDDEYLLRTPTCEGDAGKRGLGNMTCDEAKEKNRTVTLTRQIRDWQKNGKKIKLLPTPESFAQHPDLCEKEWKGMLPTPRASESIERRNMKTIVSKVENGGDVTLTTLAKYKNGTLLPTPTLQDSRIGINNIGGSQHRAERGSIALADVALGLNDSNKIHNTNSQLNPNFVLEMMGFPANYTQKPFIDDTI